MAFVHVDLFHFFYYLMCHVPLGIIFHLLYLLLDGFVIIEVERQNCVLRRTTRNGLALLLRVFEHTDGGDCSE